MSNYDFQLCPFCGNRSGTVYGLAVMEQTSDEGVRTCWVRCNKCGSQGPKITIRSNAATETMIRRSTEAWNVRHYVVKKEV